MPNKLPRADVQTAMLQVVRAFPTINVSIYRARRVRTGLGQTAPVMDATTLVYCGEAIFFPGGETVLRLAVGLIDTSAPLVVLPTTRDIRLRDLVAVTGTLYEVSTIVDFALAGMVLNLKQYQQGTV